MNEDSVGKLASELDKELSGVKSLTPRDREVLEELRRDLERILAEPDRDSHETRAVVEKLRVAAERFEATHPDLSTVMAQVINTLSNMGI